MHFVTGGAFNGKKKWVIENYDLKLENYQWFSGYSSSDVETISCIQDFKDITVIEGLEQFMKNSLIQSTDLKEVRNFWSKLFSRWHEWESGKEAHQLIIIGQDISKGIVPIDKKDRNWRDLAGWCYQDLTKKCDNVTAVWYGISQPLKGEC